MAAVVEKLELLQGPAPEEQIQRLEQATDVDQVCSVVVLFGTVVVVGRWDGGFGGELPVIDDLRSIAGL